MTDRRILAAGLAVQLAAVMIFAATAVRTLQFPYPLDYGEGHILDHVARLAAGEPLYRPRLATPPYMVFNYTPLFLLVQWPFYAAFGPALWYGRLISQLRAIVAGLCVGLTVHRLTTDRLAAALAGAAVPTATYIAYWSQLNRVDTLALAFCWAGLAAVVRSRTARGVICGVVLFTAAVFTRQTFLVAGPSAAIAWLWANRRRGDAIVFSATFAALIVTLTVILHMWTNGAFWYHTVVANMNEYRLETLYWLPAIVLFVLPGLAAAAVAAVVFLRGPSLALVWAYLIPAAAGALTVGKVGSFVNHFFEPLAGCCLALGLVVSRTSRIPGRVRIALIVLLSAHTLVTIRGFSFPNDLGDRMAHREEQRRLLGLIAAAGPPVLIDDSSALVPLAGQPLAIDPFQMKQLERSGTWSAAPLLHDIARTRFSLVLLTDWETGDGRLLHERWSPGVLQAIRQHYQSTERIRIRTGVVTSVYRPR